MRYYNFLQKYSISFGGNRARTLLTSSFTLTLTAESRESHHSPTGTCSYSWSNSMIHWTFSSLSFLLALHVTCYFSFLTLYRGNHIFGPNFTGFSILHIRTKLPFYPCMVCGGDFSWMLGNKRSQTDTLE